MTEEFLKVDTFVGRTLSIPKRIKSYEVTSVLGCGAFGVVVKMLDLNTDEVVAAKVMQRPEANSENMMSLERELRLSMTLACPYLVECMDVIYLDDIIIAIIEYIEGGTLIEAIEEDAAMVGRFWKKIFGQICLAVQYLHRRGLAHRDIKLENIMIDKEYNVKLCDYGAICETTAKTVYKSTCGTVPYMSPEIVAKNGYLPKQVDVWALGITLYAMVTGLFPWISVEDEGTMKEIPTGITTIHKIPIGPREVVTKCCEIDPKKRPTIDEILALPVLQSEMWSPIPQSRTIGKTLPKLWYNKHQRHTPTRATIKWLIPRQGARLGRKVNAASQSPGHQVAIRSAIFLM